MPAASIFCNVKDMDMCEMRVGQLGYCFMQGPSRAMLVTLTSPHKPASTASEESKRGSVSPKTGCNRLHEGRDLTENELLRRKKMQIFFFFFCSNVHKMQSE